MTRIDVATDRRAELLAIAAHQFARRGYSGTTVRHIAEAADILPPSLYHHFASKEAVFEEILRDLITDSVERYERAAGEGRSAEVVIAKLVRHAFDVMEQRRNAVIMYQNERAFLQAQSRYSFVVLGSARMDAIWLEQLHRGQRDGLVRQEMDILVVNRFIRDALWSAVRWFEPGAPYTAASLTQQFVQLLYGGVLFNANAPGHPDPDQTT